MRGSSIVRHMQEFPSDEELDDDIEIFESGSDGLYDDDEESLADAEMENNAQPNPNYDSQHWQLPEDEPWPGIEDQDRLSDGENIDPRKSDHRSDASSQPSEYPSTQRAWPDDGAFLIHEDEEIG